MTRTATPLLWALAAVQLAVGILDGTYAIMALGIAQGADLTLSGRLEEPPSQGRRLLVPVLFGLAAILAILCAALALISPDAPHGHPLSLWLGLTSAVLAVAWWRSVDLAGDGTDIPSAGSVAMRTLLALGAVIGGEAGWDWADPLGGLLLANIPLRTAWGAAIDRMGWAAPPDRGRSLPRHRKSA